MYPLIMQWTLDSEGRVSDPIIRQPSTADNTMQRCVLGVMKTLQFKTDGREKRTGYILRLYPKPLPLLQEVYPKAVAEPPTIVLHGKDVVDADMNKVLSELDPGLRACVGQEGQSAESDTSVALMLNLDSESRPSSVAIKEIHNEPDEVVECLSKTMEAARFPVALANGPLTLVFHIVRIHQAHKARKEPIRAYLQLLSQCWHPLPTEEVRVSTEVLARQNGDVFRYKFGSSEKLPEDVASCLHDTMVAVKYIDYSDSNRMILWSQYLWVISFIERGYLWPVFIDGT